MTDGILLELVKSGGISGTLIAMSLLYLALQVRALNTAVDGVRKTLGEKVFPILDQHTSQISELRGRYDNWSIMRKEGE